MHWRHILPSDEVQVKLFVLDRQFLLRGGDFGIVHNIQASVYLRECALGNEKARKSFGSSLMIWQMTRYSAPLSCCQGLGVRLVARSVYRKVPQHFSQKPEK